MIIAGASHAGKTALAHELLGHGIPHYDTDTALAKLTVHNELINLPLAQNLTRKFGKGMSLEIFLLSENI